MAGLMDEIKAYYKATKTIDSKLQGKLTIERLKTTNGWPKLKAKAAAARHLAKFALTLATRHLDKRRMAICALLCRLYHLLESEQQFLGMEAEAELPGLGRRLAELFASLAADAHRAKKKLWKITPKVHLFQHLCEWQAIELGTPKIVGVYADEDLVGQMIEVSQTCHPTTVACTAMYKWLLLVF